MSSVENFSMIKRELPEDVKIVLAAKRRTSEEIRELIHRGATDIGHNYLQEAEIMHKELGDDAVKVKWHMIGHLQKNKINRALPVFDVIQTVDSVKSASAVSSRVPDFQIQPLQVFLEINIGREEAKSGIMPDEELLQKTVESISKLQNIKLTGLMTMGPPVSDPEQLRPYFRQTKELFDWINSLNIENAKLETLSMGMSDSYKIAVEEGSNMVRLGTCIFGGRK